MNDKQTLRFYGFFQEWMREECDIQSVRVMNVEQTTNSSGYCESCYSEYEEVVVTYVDMQGKTQTYSFGGSLSEILGFEY